MSHTCPSCGQSSGGKFCRHCGAALQKHQCARCGGDLAAESRYCSRCGTPAAGEGGAGGGAGGGIARNERLIWFGAGGAVVALVGGLALAIAPRMGRPAEAIVGGGRVEAPFAGGGEVGAPDISNLTPTERFNKLFDRIMRSAESGDETTVTTFSPMALQAYAMLDSVDADARYHAALIRLHTGDIAGARALADTIQREIPGHLFGYVITGTIARFEKNDPLLRRSYADFLAHYDAEQKANRPEYQLHVRALDEFLKAARGQN